jgi:hypothetical protein
MCEEQMRTMEQLCLATASHSTAKFMEVIFLGRRYTVTTDQVLHILLCGLHHKDILLWPLSFKHLYLQECMMYHVTKTVVFKLTIYQDTETSLRQI